VIWLSWRQFRLNAMTALVAVAAVAVVLAITGPRLADLAEAGAAQVFDRLTPADITLFWAGLILVAVDAVPGLRLALELGRSDSIEVVIEDDVVASEVIARIERDLAVTDPGRALPRGSGTHR